MYLCKRSRHLTASSSSRSPLVSSIGPDFYSMSKISPLPPPSTAELPMRLEIVPTIPVIPKENYFPKNWRMKKENQQQLMPKLQLQMGKLLPEQTKPPILMLAPPMVIN